VIERVKSGADEGFLAAHSLAESYAVLTRLAGGNQLAPSMAWQLISENTVKNFSLITLSAKEYTGTLAKAAAEGVVGGRIYDALILAAAAKNGVERVYTFNVVHFQSLAGDELRKRIVAP
jgi:predicted nucleic acid-binding protein